MFRANPPVSRPEAKIQPNFWLKGSAKKPNLTPRLDGWIWQKGVAVFWRKNNGRI
jgi:hypothetical protein